MKTVSLSGSLRESVGKKDAIATRAKKHVPCVLYGGKKQVHFSIDEKELKKAIYTPEVYNVHLEIAGEKFSTIIKDSQFHPVTDGPLHVDFLEVNDNSPIVIKIPIKLKGNSAGVRSGGKLTVNFRNLAVKGMVKDIPDYIDVDITDINVGDNLRVKNIAVKNLSIVENPESVVATVRKSRGVVVEDPAAAKPAAAPAAAKPAAGSAPAAAAAKPAAKK
jgi:large subunit ribosomal protein L25